MNKCTESRYCRAISKKWASREEQDMGQDLKMCMSEETCA